MDRREPACPKPENGRSIIIHTYVYMDRQGPAGGPRTLNPKMKGL